MEFELLTPAGVHWNSMIEYAENCSWSAGRARAENMKKTAFTDWERVIAVLDRGKICGFCTVAKTDCIPDVNFTPYIGFVFVDEAHRGRRLSQSMIRFSMVYLKTLGFDRVYLTSDHENLYEKYGFTVIGQGKAYWGPVEKIYMRML